MNGMESLLIGIVVVVVVFAVARQIALWYWRVNQIVTLLESIDRRLAHAAGATPATPVNGSATTPAALVPPVPAQGAPLRLWP